MITKKEAIDLDGYGLDALGVECWPGREDYEGLWTIETHDLGDDDGYWPIVAKGPWNRLGYGRTAKEAIQDALYRP